MKTKTFAVVAGAVFAAILVSSSRSEAVEIHSDRLVRLAELEIDPAQLAVYRAALREEIETSVRVEPGVLALYAVAVKDHPNQIRLFEMYASPAAYQAHLQSAHFKKYKGATAEMVKSLRLIETEPLLLESK